MIFFLPFSLLFFDVDVDPWTPMPWTPTPWTPLTLTPWMPTPWTWILLRQISFIFSG